MALTFTESSLAAALEKVQTLHEMGCDLIAEAVFQQSDPQPHAEPIAWMVGTAFWWTKEEAERDAAATGLPVVAIGPMPTRQDEPAWFMTEGGVSAMHAKAKAMSDQQGLDTSSYCVPLYTHADPGEVERLRTVIEQQRSLIASLREDLVESRSIDASAEPGQTIWDCRPCQLGQPTGRPCDVCGGKTELGGAKS